MPYERGTPFGHQVVLNEDGETVVSLTGELDMTNASPIRRWLREAIDTVRPRQEELVLDLRSLTFMDSTGLAALIHIAHYAKALGMTLRLTHVHPHVRTIIDLTGTGTLLGMT